MRKGRAQTQLGANAPATATLVEAAWAGEASRNDEVVAAASTDLISLIGYEQQDRAAAQPWVRMARAVIERNDAPPEWNAGLAVDLGRAATAAGDFDEAIRQLRAALVYDEQAKVPPLSRATTVASLGGALFYSGRGAEAVPYFREAYELHRKHHGELHPQTAAAANNLGAVAIGVGDYATGIELVKRGLEMKRRTLGADNPELATSVNNLAEALRLGERFDEAEPHYHQAMALWRRGFGDEHPNVAEALDGLGALENDRGRPEAALAQHRRAHAIRERKHGPMHPRLAYSLTGEGKALVALGRPAEALPLLERALRLREKDADPAELAETQFALARALVDSRDDVARARRLAEAAGATYADTGQRFPRPRAEIVAWLQERGWGATNVTRPSG